MSTEWMLSSTPIEVEVQQTRKADDFCCDWRGALRVSYLRRNPLSMSWLLLLQYQIDQNLDCCKNPLTCDQTAACVKLMRVSIRLHDVWQSIHSDCQNNTIFVQYPFEGNQKVMSLVYYRGIKYLV